MSDLKLLDETPEKEFSKYFPHEKICKDIASTIKDNKDVKHKVILLSGKWGTGKTSILHQIKEVLNEKTFILFDAWVASHDFLLREFLRTLFRASISDEKEEKQKMIQGVDTINREMDATISKVTVAIYLVIFALIPLLVNVFPKTIATNGFWFLSIIGVLLVATIGNKTLAKTLFPFLNGQVTEYTEFSSQKDLTPHKVEELLKKWRDIEPNKEIIITVDNLDRLSDDAQRKYLDALYILIDKLKPYNVWFIIAVDKTQFLTNTDIEISFFDKISPYELALPELSTDISELFLSELFKNNILPIISEDIEDDKYQYILYNLKNLRKVYTYLKEQEFPKDILNPSVSHDEKLNTPRIVKKVYNQFILGYNSYTQDIDDKLSLFVACFYVACARVFNCEKQLLAILDYIHPIVIPDYNHLNSLNSILKNGKNTEKSEEEKEENNKIAKMKKIFFLSDKTIKEMVIMILYNEVLPTEEQLQSYIKDLDSVSIDRYFAIFGNNEKIISRLQEILLEELNANDDISFVQVLYQMNQKNIAYIITRELADKIFEIFDKTNYFDDIQLTEFQRDYLLDLYTKSSQNDAIQEYVCNILKIYIQNSVEEEYDNRGKTLYEILRFFSSKGISDKSLIKEFKDFTRLRQLSKEHIVQLITYSYFEFSQLDRNIRKLILKDISEEQILEIIQNTISLAKDIHSLEQRAISYLLIDLYLYRQVSFDIIKPLWEYCDNSPNKLACQIISLYDSIYHNGEYTIVEMPDPNENTVYYLLNQIHNNIYSNEEKAELIKLILNGYIHTASSPMEIVPNVNTYIFSELFESDLDLFEKLVKELKQQNNENLFPTHYSAPFALKLSELWKN